MNGPFGPPPGSPQQPFGPPSGFNPYPPQPAKAKMSQGTILFVFIGAMAVLAVLAVVFVLGSQPPAPVAPCQPAIPCLPQATTPPVADASLGPVGTAVPGATSPPQTNPGTVFVPPVAPPSSDAKPALSGELYTDAKVGYGFEYSTRHFDLDSSGDGWAQLTGKDIDCVIWVDVVNADTPPAKMIDRDLHNVDKFLIGRVADADSYDALLGPSIGYVNGTGSVWAGTLAGSNGSQSAPGGVTVVAATNGTLTAVITVIVGNPDLNVDSQHTQQLYARGAADLILKTFQWSIP